MQRLQTGDGRAFEQLVHRHQGPLLGFFVRHTHDRQLAEDLTQETLLRVYNQSWDYLPRGAFRGWMYRIGRNLLIDSTRRRSHDALLRASRPQAGEEDGLTRLVDAEVVNPVEQADRSEVTALVDRLLRELPEDQRLTFLMHHYLQLSLPEVADAMETNLPTCKSRLRLAKEKLRSLLARHGIGDPGIVPDD